MATSAVASMVLSAMFGCSREASRRHSSTVSLIGAVAIVHFAKFEQNRM